MQIYILSIYHHYDDNVTIITGLGGGIGPEGMVMAGSHFLLIYVYTHIAENLTLAERIECILLATFNESDA